jgi:hypothetical protein
MHNKPVWRNKLDPLFFELAELNRKYEINSTKMQEECRRELANLGPNSAAAVRNEIVSRFKDEVDRFSIEMDEELVKINERHPRPQYNAVAYSYFVLGEHQLDDHFVEYLHWRRHGESLRATEDGDAKGDITAWRKLARTAEDQRRIVHNKGPIKPFQGDPVHRQLLELVICFEIKSLTAEERAACMDAYCACGKTHDADAIKKQYQRLKRALVAAASAQINVPPSSKNTK